VSESAVDRQAVPYVLVVDDDADIRETMELTLALEGRTVVGAADGEAALRRLRSGHGLPCVILLDLMMPGMNGFEFLAELHKREGGRSVPVVVLTARDLSGEERLRLNGYVEKVLQKGACSLEQLLGEVHALTAPGR